MDCVKCHRIEFTNHMVLGKQELTASDTVRFILPIKRPMAPDDTGNLLSLPPLILNG